MDTFQMLMDVNWSEQNEVRMISGQIWTVVSLAQSKSLE
jgi:hypothetical protein